MATQALVLAETNLQQAVLLLAVPAPSYNTHEAMAYVPAAVPLFPDKQFPFGCIKMYVI